MIRRSDGAWDPRRLEEWWMGGQLTDPDARQDATSDVPMDDRALQGGEESSK